MTTNITNSNHLNGHNGHNGHHPVGVSVVEPSVIQSMANQLYASLPHDLGVTVPSTPAVPSGEGIGTVPPLSADVTPTEVALPNEVKTAPPTNSSVDPLTAIAQQLYCQMRAGNIDPQLHQALAGLTPSLTPPSHPATPSELPTATPTRDEVTVPTTGILPSDRFDIAAISKLAQDIYGQIPPLSVAGSPVEAIARPPHPTAWIPASEADAQRGVGELDRPTVNTSTADYRTPPTVENLHLDRGGAPFDVHVIRQDFPILHQRVHGKPLIWLDNAATTQKPNSVIDSLSRFYERDNSNIHRAAHTLAARATDAYEGAREKVQRFLGASDASEIVFARGTTEAINLVAQTFGRKYIKAGDEIILSTLEHHANIVPWQMLAQETGAVIKVIPITDRGEIIMEEYTRLLNPRTRLVSVTHVSNALGTIVPVAEITHLAHRHGARVLIDGAQAVSHQPVNVQAIDCDFYVFSGHKLFAPTGIGALYAKRELLEDLPPWQGGGSMIRHVTFEHTTYSDPPAKFEAGTPNIADAVGLGAAIDYITRLGMTNIERYEHQLTEYAMEHLARIPGLRLIGTAPHKVSVVSFILEDLPTEQVGQRLAQEGIAVRAGHHCAQPTLQRYGLTATVRPSIAFYNTHAEIDRLVEVVKNIRYQ